MAQTLSSPKTPTSFEFNRGRRPSNFDSNPSSLPNRNKTPENSPHTIHQPKGSKVQTVSTLLEIPTAQANVNSSPNRSPTRSPKEKHEHNLPTIKTEGPSPTSNYNYSGRGTIKEARSRRRKPWRKLMWVKQNFPDNYTDATFLESLQRNVNFRAYDFWPLVYDSTVIIQHLSTVIIFVCAFIAISKDKVDPAYVAGASTVFTVIGWLIWDEWSEKEQTLLAKAAEQNDDGSRKSSDEDRATLSDEKIRLQKSPSSVTIRGAKSNDDQNVRLAKTAPSSRSNSVSPKKSGRNLQYSQPIELGGSAVHSGDADLVGVRRSDSFGKPLARTLTSSSTSPTYSNSLQYAFPPPSPPPPLSRTHRRLTTLKSALLIYSTLLGLSPILKSLTRTTTSDSIWALSSWLFLVNLLCFDYGLSEGEADVAKKGMESGVPLPQGIAGPNTGTGIGNSFSKKLPTSLSTTTALTASVVLASRLTETAAVFSLLLFSIQIFGLFPLFRRRLRYLSPVLHVALTITLILVAGIYVHFVLNWQWALMWFGLVLGGGGGAAWVLMGMQRYKNEIRGPWDPAKPVFTRKQWME